MGIIGINSYLCYTNTKYAYIMKTEKHHIITIGKENLSIYHGLKELEPDVVHFLLTEQTCNHHLPIVDLLSKQFRWHTYMVKPYDGHSVEQVCEEIHRTHSGVFCYNLSEGTKIMTLAALNVAKEHGANAIFITQTGELVDLISFESAPISTPLSNTEILNLSGSRLWTYENVKRMSHADLQTSYRIKEFIERYNDEYSRIQGYFRHNCRRKIDCLPTKFRVNNDLRVNASRGRIMVHKNGLPLLNLSHANSAFLMFGGRWWEAIVASQVKLWTPNQEHKTEAWHSVVFQSEVATNQVKNEVDLLINNNRNLIFLECKSGHITQEDVYKMDSVREIYGGDSSIAALASYYPLTPLIQEKCDNLGIKVFAPSTTSELDTFFKTLPEWLTNVSKTFTVK